jgi:tricorn protease
LRVPATADSPRSRSLGGLRPFLRRVAIARLALYDNRTWKRYKGGNAPEIWIYDFAKNASEKMTDWEGSDEWPMWHDRTIYYASDRGGRTANLWAFDTDKKTHRQVTTFTDYDVKWPSIGGDSIVFEKGGYLFVMSPGGDGGADPRLVPDDRKALRPNSATRSSSRADLPIRETRGLRPEETCSLPAEKGDVVQLDPLPASREEIPPVPDGKGSLIFRWVRRVRDSRVGSDGRPPTPGSRGCAFRFGPRGPRLKKVAFSDKRHPSGASPAGRSRRSTEQDGEIQIPWSGTRWIAYLKSQEPDRRVHVRPDRQGAPVTDPLTDSFNPTFDGGKALHLATDAGPALGTLLNMGSS